MLIANGVCCLLPACLHTTSICMDTRVLTWPKHTHSHTHRHTSTLTVTARQQRMSENVAKSALAMPKIYYTLNNVYVYVIYITYTHRHTHTNVEQIYSHTHISNYIQIHMYRHVYIIYQNMLSSQQVSFPFFAPLFGFSLVSWHQFQSFSLSFTASTSTSTATSQLQFKIQFSNISLGL